MGKQIMQGQCSRSRQKQLTGEEDGLLWLSRGELGREITAAQDQALQTELKVK